MKRLPGFVALTGDEQIALSLGMLKAHLSRVPRENPFMRFAALGDFLRVMGGGRIVTP